MIFTSLPSQETYPHTPPVWFADVEETNISNAIQLLSNTSGLDNHVINQVSVSHVLTCPGSCQMHYVILVNVFFDSLFCLFIHDFLFLLNTKK